MSSSVKRFNRKKQYAACWEKYILVVGTFLYFFHINLLHLLFILKLLCTCIEPAYAYAQEMPIAKASFRFLLSNMCRNFFLNIPYRIGIQIRNMKMVFNIYGTWRWVTFEKLMMKIYDFFLFGQVI